VADFASKCSGEILCAMIEERRPPSEEAAWKSGFVPSGSGYRAVVTSDGRVVWSCRHVHFTDHSARACAEQHLKQLADAHVAVPLR
jgi:hypothetical protein